MKVNLPISDSQSRCHDAAPGSSHGWRRDTLGTFASVIVWRTEGCQQVIFAISVRVWPRSKHSFMCDENDGLYLELDDDVMKWETWCDITLTKPFLWKIAFECCDGLYQIALLDSWLVQTATPMMSFIWKEGHFSEIHRSIAQAQRKQIYDELLSPLTQPFLA